MTDDWYTAHRRAKVAAALDQLEADMRALLAGERFPDERRRERAGGKRRGPRPRVGLSPREREVMAALDGRTVAQAALHLSTSRQNVNQIRQKAQRKLLAQAVERDMDNGF